MLFDKYSINSELMLEELDESFVDEIAALHKNSLSEGIMTALGNRALVHYYLYVLKHHSQLLIGAIFRGKLVGFFQLLYTPVRTFSVLCSHPSTLLHIITLALFNTKLFIGAIMLLFSRQEETSSSPEISYIAVCQDFQGQGIGKRMVEKVNQLAAASNSSEIITYTSNKVARTMYEKLFDARVIATKVILGKEYWHLSWKTKGKSKEYVPIETTK